jgi:diguanylate cyclase (GGDEF)-like protein
MEQAVAVRARSGRQAGTTSLLRDPAIIGLALAALLVTAFHASFIGGHVLQTVTCWIELAVLHGVLVYYATRVLAIPEQPGMSRRFWRGIQLAGSIYLLGDLVQFVAIAKDPYARLSAIGIPLQAATVDVGTVLVVGVLITMPLGLTSIRERTRFWLDTATVMVAAAAFGWYYSIVPGSPLYNGQNEFQAVHDLFFGPVVMLVGLFVVVKVLLSGYRPFTKLAGIVLSLAAGVEGIIQTTNASIVGESRYSALFATTILANALLAATAIVQERQVAADPRILSKGRKRYYSLLPYGAIAAVYALLVVILTKHGLDARAWLVLGAAIGSTVLVVVRQLAAFTENARLLAELDAKVRERDELSAALRHQAFHDSLTGLANRALFTDRVDAALARGRRGNAVTIVMIIDLDDFKPVNDRLGHRAGDILLKEIAARLTESVRETDTVARLGGDEFAALLDGSVAGGVAGVAERMVQAISMPVDVGPGESVTVGASVGVAVDHDGETSTDAMMHQADVAMYAAKHRGKGAYEISGQTTRERRIRHVGGPLTVVQSEPPSRSQHADDSVPRRRWTDHKLAAE